MKRSRMIISTALFVILVFIALTPLSAADYRIGANAASEAYISGKYYDNFSKIPLTGDGATDVIAIALSQLGYQEGNSLSQLDGTTPTAGNFTEYNYNMGDFGIGYGGLEYHWCASFVSFCLYQGGCHDLGDFFDCARFHEKDTDYIWREISCQYWVNALKNAGRFYKSKYYGGSYAPDSADLIFFTRNRKQASHIGIVLYTEGNKIYTIEGNTSSAAKLEINGGGVYVKSYDKNSPAILGFGSLPYQTDPEAKKIDYSGRFPGAGYYISKGVKYLYLDPGATVRANINLPKYTMFYVNGVSSGSGLSAVLECNYNGQTYYIKNNTDRIYQITADKTDEPNVPLAPAPETTSEPVTTPPATTTAPQSETSKQVVETTSPEPETTRKESETEEARSSNSPTASIPITASAVAVLSTLASALCSIKKDW